MPDKSDSELSKRYGAAVRPLLRALQGSSTDIEATAALSGDGLMIASVLSDDVDPARFGAMCASLLALAQRAAAEIARGSLKQVLIEGDRGVMLLVQASNEVVLAVAAKPTTNLGKVFLDARKAASGIAAVI